MVGLLYQPLNTSLSGVDRVICDTSSSSTFPLKLIYSTFSLAIFLLSVWMLFIPSKNGYS